MFRRLMYLDRSFTLLMPSYVFFILISFLHYTYIFSVAGKTEVCITRFYNFFLVIVK